MIGQYINLAAKIARMMFEAGCEGQSKREALNAAISKIPPSPFTVKLQAALTREFER